VKMRFSDREKYSEKLHCCSKILGISPNYHDLVFLPIWLFSNMFSVSESKHHYRIKFPSSSRSVWDISNTGPLCSTTASQNSDSIMSKLSTRGKSGRRTSITRASHEGIDF
jgi:hypothetical protein